MNVALRTPERTAYVNARLLDPASGLDSPGALLVEDARIADLGPGLFRDGVPEGIRSVDCGGHCLAPGISCAQPPSVTHCCGRWIGASPKSRGCSTCAPILDRP